MEQGDHSKNFLGNLPLKWKLPLFLAPLLLLMQLANLAAVEHRLAASFASDLREDASSLGNSISALAPSSLEEHQESVQGLVNNVMAIEHDLAYIYVTTPAGKVIAHSFPQAFPGELLDSANRATADPNHTIVRLPAGNIHDLRVPMRNGALGTLHVGMPEAVLNGPIEQARQRLVAISLAIFLLAGALLLLISRWLTKPLADLALTSARLGGGNGAVSAPASGDEISQLSKTLDRLADGRRDDLSGRLTAERDHREDVALYRSLLDNIDLGITVISKDYEVIFANAAQSRMFGRPAESFTGRKCYREFEKRQEICSHCPGRRAMVSGKTEVAEATGIRDDGSTVNVRIKAFALRNDQQEITGFIEIVSDISNQRNLEEEMRRIKSIESIGLLAGGLAHDFNNLLTTIIGNIDLARIGADPNQDFVVRLNAAEKACEQARRLTNQLLTFAKGGQPVKKRVQLAQILDEACHFTLSGSNIRYILDAPANLWPVEIDPSQMSQVIHNLLNNAREALADKPAGKILVLAENLELDASSPLPLPPGPYVKVAIVDEGRGIPPEILATIFNPYFTTKELGATKGTGLGLTICHSIIHKHGGHISVESRDGLGATFTIYLPAVAATAPPATAPEAPPPENRQPSRRILILEDEEDVAQITSRVLVSLHHHSDVAATGAEAAKLFQQAMAKGYPYDLLILDLTIRGEMGGDEVLRKLRALAPTIPAIVTSGYTEDRIMVDHRQHGFQAALAKPFNQASLRTAIIAATARPVTPASPDGQPKPPA